MPLRAFQFSACCMTGWIMRSRIVPAMRSSTTGPTIGPWNVITRPAVEMSERMSVVPTCPHAQPAGSSRGTRLRPLPPFTLFLSDHQRRARSRTEVVGASGGVSGSGVGGSSSGGGTGRLPLGRKRGVRPLARSPLRAREGRASRRPPPPRLLLRCRRRQPLPAPSAVPALMKGQPAETRTPVRTRHTRSRFTHSYVLRSLRRCHQRPSEKSESTATKAIIHATRVNR